MTDGKSLYKLAGSLEEVVAVLCYGRSGSLFLQSLLDGHPNLIVTAGLSLHPFYSFFSDNCLLPAGQLVSKFVTDFGVIFDAHGTWAWEVHHGEYAKNWGFTCMGADRDEVLTLDKKVFLATLTDILHEYASAEHTDLVPRKLFFQAIHVAYQTALGRVVDNNTIIVYPQHAAYPRWEASQFSEDFPHAKHIFMIRQPIATLASLSRYMFTVGGRSLNAGSDHLNAIFIGGEPHRLEGCGPKSDFVNSVLSTSSAVTRWKNSSRAVRLEDLHRKPHMTLEQICTWLEIPWHESLLTSTFHGIKWWNGATSPQISGFSEATIAEKSYEDVLNFFDIFRLKVLSFRKYSVWDYEIAQWYSSIFAKMIVFPLLLVPFKMEITSLCYALSKRNISPVTKLYFLVEGLSVGRRRLFFAWLGIMSRGCPEADLLKADV